MKKATRSSTPWYFGSFIVFANDSITARQIYQEALKYGGGEKTGGAVVLPDGQEGYWELLAADAAGQAGIRHSAR